MPSIYEKALGSDFANLHPQIRKRFGFASGDKIASVGYGMMEKIYFAKLAALPLYIGTSRNIMFPQGGRNIPFTIENYAYVDRFGRETVTWIRKFKFPRAIRRFDATMIYSEQRQGIVDYLGDRQHLAVDIDMKVGANGGIRIRSGEQRFYEHALGFRFPMMFSGIANVCEWYDDALQKYKIEVEVTNRLIGTVFAYNGTFAAECVPFDRSRIPLDALPLREERRE
ncbi:MULTISPECIES: DUF4166 domain-containing protein [unclassified Paenibacillus]|uniref:DUF4166 domain-containing protein n=1 Tax=unclassified Paenibacillus TaxID=185978 RepID=UPI001C101E6D|nr:MULTISPECIES: DUF4166 domain-containing protein [unclassified Paenibacillus]MBU5440700.1 DUF4166 domain-containing protein [Paenibacillus sp. MSJ-34]CAH0120446.1 hypothetical protein PAE9249_02965 [Paenibacillus sp. CECT 9249]